MTIEEIIAIADFLGDDITEEQFWRLADMDNVYPFKD